MPYQPVDELADSLSALSVSQPRQHRQPKQYHLFVTACSRKAGNFCVLGNVVAKNLDKWQFTKGSPEWIRPVDLGNDLGAIKQQCGVGDIIRIQVVDAGMSSRFPYQPENRELKGDIEVVDHREVRANLLDALATEPLDIWLEPGLRSDAVSSGALDRRAAPASAYLIHVDNLRVEYFSEDNGSRQKRRAKFEYKKVSYDLPLTEFDSTFLRPDPTSSRTLINVTSGSSGPVT